MFIKRFLEKFRLQKFVSASTVKNVSTLMTGTFISSIIPVLTAPVMTRIFTTSDYGVLGLYFSITTLVGVLAYSHYSQAIMLEKELADAKNALWFSLVISTVVSFLFFLVLCSLSVFTTYIQKSEIGLWLFLAPLSVFLNGITASLMVWANKVQLYKVLARNRIIQAIITLIVQLSLGLCINDETGLMAGLFVGQLMSAVLLLRVFLKKDGSGIGGPGYKEFRRIAVQHRDLFLYNTPTSFINTFINQAPIFLLQKFGGISYVGSYNFTQRLLGLPQQFLSSAIVEVFKEKASSQYNKYGNCQSIFLKTSKTLALIAIVPFAIFFLFGPYLFEFIFGAQWKDAGIFASFLSIMFFLRFIVSPLTYVYFIVNRLKEHFLLHIVFLVLTFASFFIGDKYLEDKRYLILVYSLVYSSIYILYYFRSYRFSKIYKVLQ
ncbi:MAG: oligosaccharide flippase family protein [Chitinophagaceae bacterium]|nr:oligosaccharide flippase family protein [Chitinophagaceae bacterium]